MCFDWYSSVPLPSENADQDAMNSFLDQLFQPLIDELDAGLLASSIKGGGGKKKERGSVRSSSTGQSAAATGGPPPPPPPPPAPVISNTQASSSSQSTSGTGSLSELLKSASLKSAPSTLPPPPLNAPIPPPSRTSTPPVLPLSPPPSVSGKPPVPLPGLMPSKLTPIQSESSASSLSLKPSTTTPIVQSASAGVPLPPPPPPVPLLSNVPSQPVVVKSEKAPPPPTAPKPKRSSRKLSVSNVDGASSVQSDSSNQQLSSTSSSQQVITTSQQISHTKTVVSKQVTVVQSQERITNVLHKTTSKEALPMAVLASSTDNLVSKDSEIVPPPVAFKGDEPSSSESFTSGIMSQPQQSVVSSENVTVKQVSSHQKRKVSRQIGKEVKSVGIVEPVPSREKVRKLSMQIEKQLQTASNIQRRASRKVARTKSIYRPGTKVTANAAVRTADPEKNAPPCPAQKISLYTPIKTSTITYNNPSWSFRLCKEVTS